MFDPLIKHMRLSESAYYSHVVAGQIKRSIVFNCYSFTNRFLPESNDFLSGIELFLSSLCAIFTVHVLHVFWQCAGANVVRMHPKSSFVYARHL